MKEVEMELEFKAEDILVRVLDLCKHAVSGPDGKVPENLHGLFETIQKDSEGNPLVNTLSGVLLYNPQTGFVYSPLVSSEPQTLAVEVANLSNLFHELNVKFVVGKLHHVDGTGSVYFGEEAIKMYALQTERETILKVKKYQDEKGAGLILPDRKIITR